jgi:F-type H+-transporting ATPase subunit delta
VDTLAHWLRESAPFRSFVENPLIPVDQRSEILDRLVGGQADPVTVQFLRLLDEKGRLAELEAVCAVFRLLHDKAENVLRIEITSATPLTDEQAGEIAARFGRRFGKKVRPARRTDASLRGGFKVRAQDTIHDYSIQAQLESLRKRLLNA